MSVRISTAHPLASRRFRVCLWIVFAVIVAVQVRGVWSLCVHGQQLCDFGHFYYAAAAWRTGDASLYAPNLASSVVIDGRQFELRNVASPAWHVVVLPFTFVPPTIAFLLWVACNLGAWLWSLRICATQWEFDVDRRWSPLIALAILSSTLTAGAFHTGQYVGVMMLPATLAWRAARERRWTSAGAWLGWLAYSKPFVLLFIAWLVWKRQWRALTAAAIVVAAALIVGELVFGLGIHLQWRASLQRDVAGWTWLYVNASAWAPWARAFGPSPSFAHWLNSIAVVLPALASAVVIGVVSSWVVLRRVGDTDSVWTVLWLAAILISPLGWTYYLWLGAGPFAVVVLRLWRKQPRSRWAICAIGACFWLPLNVLIIGQPSVAASFSVASLFTWALIGFWILGVCDARTQIPSPASS